MPGLTSPPSSSGAGPFSCPGCRRPILRGQARWTGREPGQYWHDECAVSAGLSEREIRLFYQNGMERHISRRRYGIRLVFADDR